MFAELRELLHSGAIRRHSVRVKIPFDPLIQATKNTAPNGIAEYRQKAVS